MKTIKNLLILILSLSITNCASDKKENAVANEEVAIVEDVSVSEVITPETLAVNGLKMYVIEREIPGAGNLTADELKGISQVSCGVLKEMGSEIQWLHSYVTGDKIYCVYTAPNKEMVVEHAEKGGFPANSVSSVATIISPDTAELEE